MKEAPRHFHFLGICGTAMGSVAAAMSERGFTVTGSDENIYPPMSTFLEERKIALFSGYRAENIPAKAEVVVIGNAIKRGNPEAEAILNRKLFYLSLPEVLKSYFLGGRHNLVVTGTHGKQTHLGNLILSKRTVPDDLTNDAGLNITDLKSRIDTGMYLTPHSDIVALMVLEHQTEMHNRIAAANYQTKLAHRDADVINELDNAPKGRLTEGTARRVDSAAEQLVKYLADAHSIEEQALQQLRAAPDAAGDPELAAIFRNHLVETEGHERATRQRLEAHVAHARAGRGDRVDDQCAGRRDRIAGLDRDDVAAGRISMPIARRLPLAAAAEAHRLMESGGLCGKIVLET